MVGNIFGSIFLSGQLSRNTKTHSTHPLYAEWHIRPQGRLQIIIQVRLQSINRVRSGAIIGDYIMAPGTITFEGARFVE